MQEPPKGVTFFKKIYNIKMIPCQNFRKIKNKSSFASMGEKKDHFLANR
jgi:hypothetical protein